MNSVNMLMNTLKREVPKKEPDSNKSSMRNGFNDILDKTIDNNSKKTTKDVYKENSSENSNENINSSTESISGKKEEYAKDNLEDKGLNEKLEEAKDEKDDYDKIKDMLSYLNIIMNNNNQELLNTQNSELSKDFIGIDLKNVGNLNSYLDMLNMVSSNEELSTLLNNLDDENQKLLLMLKLMTSSSMEDVEKYLKENLNLSQPEIDKIMKSIELQKSLEKLMKGFNSETDSSKEDSSVKDILEGIIKPVEKNEKLDSNLSTLLDEDGEDTKTSTKEETLLKNIMNGSSGMKNFSIREVALNQSSKISEQPMVRQGNFAEDVIKSIRYMDVNNLKELTVKVVPKELGELVIKLTIESGIMKANLNATNKEAYELLSANFKDISDKLQNNNIKIGEVNINLYEDDTTFFSDDSRKGNFNQEEKNKRPYKFQNEEELVSEGESVDKSYLSYFV